MVNDVITSYEGTEEMLFSTPKNPYESIYIRAKISNGILTVTDSECEHAPDGGWSHRILEFDENNTEEVFRMLLEINPNTFIALKNMFNYQDRTEVFRKKCDERGIEYKNMLSF